MTRHLPSRRSFLIQAGATTIAVCLAGCSGGSATPSASDGPVTVDASSVPVGGGIIAGRFVVTQPKAGSFVAFDGRCTHENQKIEQVTSTAIVCGHHGSTFKLADGAVITGPASKPLVKATATLNGDKLTISA